MNPTDPNVTPPASPTEPSPSAPSYLDVIAEPDKSKSPKLFGILPKKVLFIAAGVLVALIAILTIASVVNNAQKAANAQVTALSTKINELRVIIGYIKYNPISSSTTATVAAEADIIVISHFRELTNVYPTIDPESYLDEAQVPAITELNDAKARGDLDSVYTETLRNQLLSICNQLEILQESASEAQKEVLSKAYSDFQELTTRLPAAD
jgi:hypothetical protein